MATRLLAFVAAAAMLFVMMPMSLAAPAIQLIRANEFVRFHEFPAPTTQGSERFGKDTISLMPSNAQFADTSTSSFVTSADGWSKNDSPNGVGGTLNMNDFFGWVADDDNLMPLKDTIFSHFPNTHSSADPYVLAMAANHGVQGASLSFSQTLPEFWADGFFEVSVDFYAVNTDSAIYLASNSNNVFENETHSVMVAQATDWDGEESTKDGSGLTMGKYQSTWQTAKFLIKTDARESVSFTLNLHLGLQDRIGSGFVLYDNIQVTAYSESNFGIWETAQRAFDARFIPFNSAITYVTNPAQEDVANNIIYDVQKYYAKKYYEGFHLTTMIDMRKADEVDENIAMRIGSAKTTNATPFTENFDSNKGASSTFEWLYRRESSQTLIRPFAPLRDIAGELGLEQHAVVFDNNKPDNQGVMLLAANEGNAGVRMRDSFVLDRGNIYAINFYALSHGNTFARLRDVRADDLSLPEHISPFQSSHISIGMEAGASARSRNGWAFNTIFVVADHLEDVEVKLEFWVGNEDSTIGYLLIDDLSIVRVSNKYFRAFGEGANTNTVLVHEGRGGSTGAVSNAQFNQYEGGLMFPAVATNWDVQVKNDDHSAIINGVVNTQDSHWEVNANKDTENGRAYGMATNPRAIGVHSNNNVYMMQNLWNDTYQKVSSQPFLLNLNTRNVVSFYASTQVTDLESNEINAWAILEINNREISRIELPKGNSPWRYYSFVVETSRWRAPNVTISFILGEPGKAGKGILFVDDINVGNTHPGRSNGVVNLADPVLMFDRNNNSIFFEPGCEDISARRFVDRRGIEVLQIVSDGPVNSTVSNTLIEELDGDTYYKYTVTMQMGFTTIGQNSRSENNDNFDSDYGIVFRLSNTESDGTADNEFTLRRDSSADSHLKDWRNDISRMQPDLDGFFEIVFFINARIPFDLALEIEFGNESMPVQSTVSIRKTELEVIDETVYETAMKDGQSSNVRLVTSATERDTTTRDPRNRPQLDWLIAPSIIMTLAIFVAIGGTILKRHRFKLHINKHSTSYARDDRGEFIKPKKSLKATKAVAESIVEK
jgi:hypothetical protein